MTEFIPYLAGLVTILFGCSFAFAIAQANKKN